MLLEDAPPSVEPRRLRARARAFESVAALAACFVASVLVSLRLLRADMVSDDALVHQFWMYRFQDAALFGDPLTAELRGSQRYPDGYELLFRLASELFDPIAFGEWLGVGLMALSGWLVFLIVREHTDWRPAAWIAAGAFLALINIHRFHGGFPRAFVHPVVLTCVLLALRDRLGPAALVAAGGALLYPPASLLAVGVLALCAVGRLRPRPRLDPRRTAFAVLAGGLALAAVLVPQAIDGGAPRVFTAAEARAYPDFGAAGPLHFFADSTLTYLRQNRSGFDLQGAGSVLVLAALALLLIRLPRLSGPRRKSGRAPAAPRRRWRRPRSGPWLRHCALPASLPATTVHPPDPRPDLRREPLRREVLALPVVALAAFAVAQLVLFKLYLPHRYTYPLVAFCAIAIGVALRPAWQARPLLVVCVPVAAYVAGVWAFPLGPRDAPSLVTVALLCAAGAAALALRRAPGRSAAVIGIALVVALLGVPDRAARGSPCPTWPAARFIATLPKDAIVAGDPYDLKCIPFTARRAVVISTQLAPAYEVDYFLHARERLYSTLRAYYGPSVDAIADLRRRYGATHLWLRREEVERELRAPNGRRWHPWQDPYGRFVRRLLSTGTPPAVLDLPTACRVWARGGAEVYDLACVSRSAPAAAPRRREASPAAAPLRPAQPAATAPRTRPSRQ